jgi:class 3 adenylate cyclase
MTVMAEPALAALVPEGRPRTVDRLSSLARHAVRAPQGRAHARAMIVGLALAAAPALGIVWLLTDARRNGDFLLPTEHFMIVTIVALLAASVAVLVALQVEQYSVSLIALGFMSMAGLFAVHALATPGVPLHGLAGHAVRVAAGDDYSGSTTQFDYRGTVIGISAFLSLFVPALLFAAGATRGASAVLRRLPAHSAVGLTVGVVVGYAVVSGYRSDLIAGLILGRAPWSYALAGLTILLLGYAAWQEIRLYGRTRFPSHGAFGLAYILLAEAQLLVLLAPFWSIAWWEYHVLMLAAAVLALGALLVELRRRRALERFLPPPVVERVVAGDLSRLMAGERRVVTILFADLRGSTALAERMQPEEVVEVLNDYVGALARCVVECGGMVRQFLGDGLMAIFGAFSANAASDGAAEAIEATLRMRRAVAEVNSRTSATMRFGVGVHTGEVVLGLIGIAEQAEITAFGDTVNTASRLQDVSKQFVVDSVLSVDTLARLGSRAEAGLRPLGAVDVRGREQKVDVFTLRD